MLGKPYAEVHRNIDRPYVFLGRKHRAFFHSPEEAFVVGSLATAEPRGGLAGLWHVWLDEKGSKDKEFRRFVETMANYDSVQEKMMRKFRARARAQKKLMQRQQTIAQKQTQQLIDMLLPKPKKRPRKKRVKKCVANWKL